MAAVLAAGLRAGGVEVVHGDVLRHGAGARAGPGGRRRRGRARRRGRGAPGGRRHGRDRLLGADDRGAPGLGVGGVRRRGRRRRAGRRDRGRPAGAAAPDERLPDASGVPRAPQRDLAHALAAPARRRRPRAGPHDDPARLVHDEAQRGRGDGADQLAGVRGPAPVRTPRRRGGLTGDDRGPGALARGADRLRRGVAAAQRGQPGRAGGAAGDRRVPPVAGRGAPGRVPDPGERARHERGVGGHGGHAGRGRRDLGAGRRRPGRPAREGRASTATPSPR